MKFVLGSIKWTAILLTVLVTTVGGFALGTLGADIFSSLPLGWWERLASPPDEAVKIIGIIDPNMKILTATGQVYDCPKEGMGTCVKSSLPSEFRESVLYRGIFDCAWRESKIPTLSGHVVDSVRYRSCTPESGGSLQYFAILDDGTIWRWGLPSVLENVINFSIVIGTGIIGLFGSMWLLSRKPNKKIGK